MPINAVDSTQEVVSIMVVTAILNLAYSPENLIVNYGMVVVSKLTQKRQQIVRNPTGNKYQSPIPRIANPVTEWGGP